MAEEVGFEPTVRFPVQRFSRPPPSTTRPPLRALQSFAFSKLQRRFHLTTGRLNYEDFAAGWYKSGCSYKTRQRNEIGEIGGAVAGR